MSIFNSDLRLEEITSLLKDVKKSLHFIGILGSGMYPLALLLHQRGYTVSGSDDNAEKSAYTDLNGINVSEPTNAVDADIVVYSLAISEENSEIMYAKAHNIPLISRAQLLGALMSDYPTRVSVSGSHGKSTVTALIDHIFAVSGMEHTTVSGAKLSSGASLYDGGGEVFIAEACEYKDSFLRLCPTHQLISAVELDHTDYFKSPDMLRSSFMKAADRADVLLVNCDDSVAKEIADEIVRSDKSKMVFTYGKSHKADYRIAISETSGGITSFSVSKEECTFNLRTALIGEFNFYNIAAAVAMSDILGISKENIEQAVGSFLSIERRMTLIAESEGVPIYYDYAHHPSEIRAVITALKERYTSVSVIFRPHTYSRTLSLWSDFITELSKADFTIILDIYPAREKYIPGVESRLLALEIPNCVYSDSKNAAQIALSHKSSAIVLLGAGEVEDVKHDLIEFCKNTGDIPDRR